MRRNLNKWISGLIVVVIVVYVVFTLVRPLPDIKPTLAPLSVKTASTLVWPNQGESAVGVVGTNIVDTYGTQTPKPTASTAKLITALMVLRAKPLGLNEPGPTITLTQSDVNIYGQYLDEQGSVAPVVAGEQLSEYQMLQAMLLPSANNIADSLAIWAYGSLSNYSAMANTYVRSLGLSSTTIGPDASGFNPASVSTASDLVRLGEKVMQNPVLASIVDQTSATLPVAGIVRNVNNLVGQDNIVGIKTGNTDQAGGVFVGAVKFAQGSDSRVIVTANVGASSLKLSLTSSATLLSSVQSNFHNTTLVNANAAVASYKAPWAKTAVSAIVNKAIVANIWGGDSFSLNLQGLKSVSYKAKSGDNVGEAYDSSLDSSSAEVSLTSNIPGPSITWRLLHP